jgi:hypothetical protein
MPLRTQSCWDRLVVCFWFWGDVVSGPGLEPGTNALKGRCSTN